MNAKRGGEGLDLTRLRTPEPGVEYYQFTFTGTPEDRLRVSVYSHWAGWADEEQRQELREASLVNPDPLIAFWTEVGESYLVVNDLGSLALYLRAGGHALIKKEIAEECLPEHLAPHPSAMTGPLGFTASRSLPDGALKRAPSPKHRMRILDRDGRRCRICGRSADDHVDVELHVHHIRPWGRGGTTADENLITLCQTCHKGLDPHEDWSLFELADPGSWPPERATSLEEYNDGVRRYRERVGQLLEGQAGDAD